MGNYFYAFLGTSRLNSVDVGKFGYYLSFCDKSPYLFIIGLPPFILLRQNTVSNANVAVIDILLIIMKAI